MIGIFFVSLTGLCCLVIVGLTAVVLGNIAYFGWGLRRYARGPTPTCLRNWLEK